MAPFARRALLAFFLSMAAVGCKSSTPASTKAPGPASSPPPNVTEVAAEVVVVDCPDSTRLNPRAAEGSINRLVEGCTTVPGGTAHFAATLEPGGRIELTAPDGNQAEGVVPTCVLKHELSHKLPLKQACKLDVKLVEKQPGAS